MHSHGEMKVTVGASADAEPTANNAYKANSARFTAPRL